MNWLRIKYAAAFSRLEYALKEGGYAIPGRNNIAEIDWDKFKKQVASSEVLENNSCVQEILRIPPRKQTFDGTKLSWADVSLGGDGKHKEAVEATRRLRNNLFHGGKGNEAAFEQESSDELLGYGLCILKAILDADAAVKYCFWDCFDTEFESRIFDHSSSNTTN